MKEENKFATNCKYIKFHCCGGGGLIDLIEINLKDPYKARYKVVMVIQTFNHIFRLYLPKL